MLSYPFGENPTYFINLFLVNILSDNSSLAQNLCPLQTINTLKLNLQEIQVQALRQFGIEPLFYPDYGYSWIESTRNPV